MLLRVVLFLGVGLVLAAFGAAGWQYWQSLPAAPQIEVVEVEEIEVVEDTAKAPDTAEAEPDEDLIEPGQAWLISDMGGLVPRRDAQNFLQQGKFVKNRTVSLRVRLPLTALLSEGEALPGDTYLLAFAEVRAGVAGAKLCAPLVATWAQGCAISDVGLVDDSYDAATQTVLFEVTAPFTLKPESEPLPDLATRSFTGDYLSSRKLPVVAQRDTPEEFLAGVAASIGAHCAAAQAAGRTCRVMSVSVGWNSPTEADFNANFGELGPLPKGMYTAPPLY